jgi:hypothetical protein
LRKAVFEKRIQAIEDRLSVERRILPHVVIIDGENEDEVEDRIRESLNGEKRKSGESWTIFVVPAFGKVSDFERASVPARSHVDEQSPLLSEVTEESLDSKSDEELEAMLQDLRKKQNETE